jgi:hypothetical protein
MKKLYILILILIVISAIFYFSNFGGVNHISEKSVYVPEVAQDENGNFALYVSNQSFDISPVDVNIMIDDVVYINLEYDVGDQHEYFSYRFMLSPGTHTMKVVSVKGDAMYQGDFEIVDSARGVVEYWYYSETDSNPTPRKFNVSFGPDELLLID